ncbi:DegT/DnrJ/EryC1/StrS family aminotransferase [soil metagenome]
MNSIFDFLAGAGAVVGPVTPSAKAPVPAANKTHVKGDAITAVYSPSATFFELSGRELLGSAKIMIGMRVPFYDIKAQYDELAEPLTQSVQEVLSGGGYVLGPHCHAIEQELADLHGVKHGIGLNSGTDALRIMMDAAEIGPGDEVITTAFTFVASAETIVQTGARPVFVDIDPNTYDIDPANIAAAITPKTKAILPIHLFGQMADMDPIMSLAGERGLTVIEDAAQALVCSQNGRSAGQFGIAAGLSFYVTKNLGAAGDAGMILTDDDEIARRCRSIRVHGMGRERYHYDYLGYTSRMDEIQAAVLRVKLTALTEWNARRASVAETYLSELKGLDLQLPVIREGNTHTWHQFCVLTPRRDELMAFLKAREIDSMIYYPIPLHLHGPYKQFGNGLGSLPITERVSKQILSLPMHPHLCAAQVQNVINAVRAFYA